MSTSNLLEVLPAEAGAASLGRVLLEQHLQLICQTLERLSRRRGLAEHEAAELRSWAMFKLVENDYRTLGSWKGRSSFSTFLTVVLVSLMRDYLIHSSRPAPGMK